MERSNDGEQSQCQDLCMTDEVPLAYFQRQGVLFKELMHQTDAARLISFSPNDVNFLVTAVELRLFTVAIVKSTDHLSVIQKARFLFQEGLGFRVHHLPSGALRRGASSHQDFRHRLFRGGQATSDVSVNREAEETQSVQPQNDDPEPSEGGEDLDNAEEDLLG